METCRQPNCALRLEFGREPSFFSDKIRALSRLADGRDQPGAEARDVVTAHIADV